MTFLPVVDRELRVAARRRETYAVRVIAGLAALIISAAQLPLMTRLSQAQRGRQLFFVAWSWFPSLPWFHDGSPYRNASPRVQ